MNEADPGKRSGWWRVSLRAQGVAVLAVPAAALIAALFSIYAMEAEVAAAEQVQARAYSVRADLSELQVSLGEARGAARAFAASGDPAASAAYDAARGRAGSSQGKLAERLGSAAATRAYFDELRGLNALEMEQLEAIRSRQGGALAVQAADQTLRRISAAIAGLNDVQDRDFQEARLRREAARRRLLNMLLLCGIAGTFGGLFVHLVVAGRQVQRLRMVKENARRMADGLAPGPPPQGSDEIAELGRQLQDAAARLGDREREARESEARYRDLFDRAPVPYEETDAEGVIRRVNQAVCTLMRCKPAQLIGRGVWELAASGDQERCRAEMLRRIASGVEGEPFECEYQLEIGGFITVEVRESLIRGQHGEVTGTVRSLLDVTERNLAAVASGKVSQYAMELRIRNEQLARTLEAARSATVAKSRFLASVSHELRTPLNGIIGFSELLYDQKLGPLTPEQLDVLGDILSSARHLLGLINDILDLSKIEAGRMEFHPEPHRLADLVGEVRDVIRPLAERKAIALTMDAPAELQAVLDGARFKQVVYNYLSNAVKFTPDGGAIAVRVRLECQDRFRLEVEDTGLGIEEEELPRLFQEFGQLANSRRAGQGTGLGLALTRHLVEAQGGSVGVHSQPGKGSNFFAVLPVVMEPRPANTLNSGISNER